MGKRARGEGHRDGAARKIGDCRGPWVSEAVGEGERPCYHPLLGKQSTKPLKVAALQASVRSWHAEQITCPEGSVSLSSVCIMKTLRAGGGTYVGN